MAKRLTQEEVIGRCNILFNYKYIYTQSVYVSTRVPMDAICPIHGKFSIPPKRHLQGQGCPFCGAEYARTWRKGNWKHFIEESQKRFGDVYDFINIEEEYENSHSTIHLKCKKCGNTFPKIACDHLTSPFGGCHHCYSNISSSELEIGDYIQSLISNDEILLGDRVVLKGKELDIFIPSKNIAIEFDGLRYHNDSTKPRNYHLSKTEECEKHGIKLIHIFEDEWLYKQNIVKSMISDTLNSYQMTLDGESCHIKRIDNNESKNFLSLNHIQDGCEGNINYALIKDSEIVSLMVFKKYNKNKYKLMRFCNKLNTNIINGEIILFNKFITENNPSEILFYVDRRYCSTRTIENLGFKPLKKTKPDYCYVNKDRRINKADIKLYKNKNFNKIYDCGNIVYKWTKDNL